MQDISQFDFVIVGAGCALAGRLSENPDCSVALVEAGPSDRNWRVQTPVALVNLMRNPKFNWMFDSAPQTQLDGRTMATPRGKTLGGSSSINSMVYIRGRATDYDAWEQSGCDGWGWRSVLPYFRKAENNTRLRDEFHGHDGPLIVGDLPSPHPLCNDWIAAGESVGIPHNTDFNGKNQEGLGIYQVTMQNGRRWSASDAYLGRIGSKRNLTVFTDTEVLKIDTKANRANSIVVTHAGRTRSIRVAKELILSAGAIGSPKLLLESGIGPEADLNKLGIPVVHNLGAVGENLQEHVSIGIAEKCDAGRGLSLPTLPSILWSPFRYLLRGDGLMSTNHVEAGGFARTDDSLDEPDVQFHMIPARVGVESKGVVWGRGYFADACLLKPRSRGRLTIRGTTNGFQPIIDFNALHDANDRIRIVAAFRLLRRIMKADPLARHNPVEGSPGRHLESDEEIYEHCKRRLGTAYHPVGTCRMGPADRSDSVVDPNLRLLGMKNMRIVDASVMPELIAGNTNAPTIMIAEYAAHKILGGLG